MEEELLYFNGINGATGDYLLPQLRPDQIGRIALGEKWEKGHLDELKERNRRLNEGEYAIKAGMDPNNLAEVGWGIIFPTVWEAADLASIEEALGELLRLRQSQARSLYKVFKGGDGYRPGETKNDFLARHGVGPGIVDPKTQGVPYYLLIVGDPHTIPYRFQYELSVAYLVGRIHFDTLDEYAQYARSIVTTENSSATKLPRRSVFVGVANNNDKATQLSTELLVKPMADKLQKECTDWQIDYYSPDKAYKADLLRLLGGDDTPAFLFTANHGLGFSYDDSYQLPFQGALLCQDWPGPTNWKKPVSRDFYLGGEDISSDANLLGLVSFHFACYSAGTPHWDEFSKQAFTTRSEIAPHAFLAALPKRLLSHPRGGALAVIGHVERAWTYSFKWGKSGTQSLTFEDMLTRMMAGETVGNAMDGLHLRYAEISTMLSNEVEEAEYSKPDLIKLANLWTANNDARSYALIGDPAVRLPVARKDEPPHERSAILEVDHHTGKVPPILAGESLVVSPDASQAVKEQSSLFVDGTGKADAFLDEDAQKKLRDDLTLTLQQMVTRLTKFVDGVSSLDISTYVSSTMDQVEYDKTTHKFTGGVVQRIVTHIDLNGDTLICLPKEAGEGDEALWAIHSSMVEKAQSYRKAMLKAAAEVITSLLQKGE